MIQSLNQNIANDRIEMPYPHVEVLTPSNAVALVVPSLTTGDLPVICKYDGTTRRIGSIARSALVLSSLRKVTRLKFAKSANEVMELNNTEDIMEALS